MIEKSSRLSQNVKPLSREEARHRTFIASGKFDAIKKKTLYPGDRVVMRTRPMAACKAVTMVGRDSVSVKYEDGNTSGQSTLRFKDVRRAEDYEEAYEKFLREQSQKGV